MAKISIIICTCNLSPLKQCIDALRKNTDFEKADAEVIVAMNGCQQESLDYVRSLGENFRFIWVDRRVGLCTMANLAVKVSEGKYIVRLDDDTIILDWGCDNRWLDLLMQPFLENKKTGQSGPVLETHPNDQKTLVGFLTMTTRELWDQIGGLDLIFDPGGHEDKDYSLKIQKMGYEITATGIIIVNSPEARKKGATTFSGNYPIFHISREDYKPINGMSQKDLSQSWIDKLEVFRSRYGFV